MTNCNKNPFKCVLCEKSAYKNSNGIVRHILSKHKEITVEEYVMKYITKEMLAITAAKKIGKSELPIEWRLTDKCFECGKNKCKLQSFGKGFSVFCSEKCSTKNPIKKEITDRLSRKALKEKYNVEFMSQIPGNKEKVQKTSMEKYGTLWPSQSEVVKEKIIETNFEKYNAKSYTQTNEHKEKVRKTSKEKYNVEHFTQSSVVKEKHRQTCLEVYGKEYYTQTKEHKEKSFNRIIIENGLHLHEWYINQPDPKPSYSHLAKIFTKKYISLQDVENYFEDYLNNKTDLESKLSKFLDIKHYNKTPDEIERCFRPDFKLNDTTYLNADGLYWHCELNRENNWQHFELRKEFEDNGLRIFQFYTNEIQNKIEIIKSIIGKHLLNKTNNNIININNCAIKQVQDIDAKIFLEKNHIKCFTFDAKHLGLYNENKLVLMISYRICDNICLIKRICNINNINTNNIYSNLFSYLQKDLNKNINEIHYWANLRYETGSYLLPVGFNIIKDELDCNWTDGQTKIFNKKQYDSHDNKLKLYKIYGAGRRLYVKHLYE